ncbi:MAG: DUF507 family protein [Nitrospirae bacterium]|nr:MAG: DUF507 family protein [Nitrospirota bacterium]
MRIPKSWVLPMARRIVEDLLREDLIDPTVSEEELIEHTRELLMEELTVEDRLNEEVREILKQFEHEIEAKRLDYRKLFEMTKRKLIKERNIVI